MFVRSPAAYEALKGFNLLQLPSRATLQAYTGAFIDDPGEVQSTTVHAIHYVLYIGAYQKRIAEAHSKNALQIRAHGITVDF